MKFIIYLTILFIYLQNLLLVSSIHMPYIDATSDAIWNDQNYPNGRPNPLFSQQVINLNADGIVFGFITLATSNNSPCWAANTAMPLNWSLPLANELKAGGKKVVISFGGASNQDISMGLTVSELVQVYTNTINWYGADQLDFDLENGQFKQANIAAALKQVQTNYPNVVISFTLPVLPTGLTTSGLSIVQSAIDAGVSFIVNIMAMDYYQGTTTQMGDAAIQAIQSLKGQLATKLPSLSNGQIYAKIAVTPMIGKNDDSSMFTLSDASKVAVFAKQNGIAYTSMWSLNRDSASGSENPDQTKAGQYTQTFVNSFASATSSTTSTSTTGSSTTATSSTSTTGSSSTSTTGTSSTSTTGSSSTTTGTTSTTSTKPSSSTSSSSSSSTTANNDKDESTSSSSILFSSFLFIAISIACILL